MISDKEKQIRDSLANKEYREALAVEHVNTTLAIQIRKMRESRNWNQDDLAGLLGKHQETISQWENPDYGRHTITTLKSLAAAFDVALLVKFIPFSELVRDMLSLSEVRLSPPSFSEERNHIQALVSEVSNFTVDTKDKDAYELRPIDKPSIPPTTVDILITTPTTIAAIETAKKEFTYVT
jgi:transcriptional regulator with XRE-family HTH domain